MRKICFTVQRYGLEVNGGAELLTRQLAERMASDYDVHVFTTKAIDYMTWADEYDKDEEVIGGVTVHRFSVAKTRDQDEFDAINGRKFVKENFAWDVITDKFIAYFKDLINREGDN